MMTRKIDYIAVHCTAGRASQTVTDLEREFKRKGWVNPGYHFVVTEEGKIHQLLDVEKVSNGVKGWNHCIVNVAYTGGVNPANAFEAMDTRTEAQKDSLRKLLKLLKRKYPKAVIQGHRDFPGVKKACPSFDAKTEYKDI